MSRSRRDWDKDRRDQTGLAAVREIAQDHALDDEPPKSFADAACGEKLKGAIRLKVRGHKPDQRLSYVAKQAYAIERVLHEARIHILASEAKGDGTVNYMCQMKIEYSYGHLHLDVVDLVSAALGATRTASCYDLLFWLRCSESTVNC
jgi:hypothetical protein